MVHSLASTGSAAKVYYVNGPVGSSEPTSSTWANSNPKKRRRREKADVMNAGSGIRLIQDLDFPEASYRVKSTRDGRYLVATGTYKPRMKVWDLQEMSLKFERVTDSENVDFLLLSDDWTKSVHLQADRTIDFHNQAQSYYRTRIPKFGRTINYHYPSCDVLAGGDGGEVFRLNLEQGRFMNPFKLEGNEDESLSSSTEDIVTGVNAIDVNPAHQLFAFGTETELGKGTVEFWDPRVRTRVGILRLPYHNLVSPSQALSTAVIGGDDETSSLLSSLSSSTVSVTALASRDDGLNLAVGTSTGHTLLYDIRQPRPYNTKDQGYGLPVKQIRWPHTPAAENTDGLVATVDSKVLKVWDRDTTDNILSVNPPSVVNDIHFYPSSGLIFLANEDTPMTSFYVPELGPAPKWARFLDNMTEEMEQDQQGTNLYADYKFIDKKELLGLGLDHLVGTPTLKPYMHGYFVDHRLYAKAKAIANPFAYQEYREKKISERLEKERESRIRSSDIKTKAKNNNSNNSNKTSNKVDEPSSIAVNQKLAERIRAKEEKEMNKLKKRKHTKEDEQEQQPEEQQKESLLSDSRFGDLFQDPEFAVDEKSKAFALSNPSAYAQNVKKQMSRIGDSDDSSADEQEQEIGTDDDNDASEDEEESESEEEEEDDDDDEDEQEIIEKMVPNQGKQKQDFFYEDEAAAFAKQNKKNSKRPQLSIEEEEGDLGRKEHRLKQQPLGKRVVQNKKHEMEKLQQSKAHQAEIDAAMGDKEFTFVPSSSKKSKQQGYVSAGDKRSAAAEATEKRRQKVLDRAHKEEFGAGLLKGASIGDLRALDLEDEAAHGRQRRRNVSRSASKTAIRKSLN